MDYRKFANYSIFRLSLSIHLSTSIHSKTDLHFSYFIRKNFLFCPYKEKKLFLLVLSSFLLFDKVAAAASFAPMLYIGPGELRVSGRNHGNYCFVVNNSFLE